MHDSSVAEAGKVYEKLVDIFDSFGGMCTVDGAFSKGNYPFLIKSSQTDPHGSEELIINREATSMRQSAEWGMRALQGSFPRLKDKFLYEEGGKKGNVEDNADAIQLQSKESWYQSNSKYIHAVFRNVWE